MVSVATNDILWPALQHFGGLQSLRLGMLSTVVLRTLAIANRLCALEFALQLANSLESSGIRDAVRIP